MVPQSVKSAGVWLVYLIERDVAWLVISFINDICSTSSIVNMFHAKKAVAVWCSPFVMKGKDMCAL